MGEKKSLKGQQNKKTEKKDTCTKKTTGQKERQKDKNTEDTKQRQTEKTSSIAEAVQSRQVQHLLPLPA